MGDSAMLKSSRRDALQQSNQRVRFRHPIEVDAMTLRKKIKELGLIDPMIQMHAKEIIAAKLIEGYYLKGNGARCKTCQMPLMVKDSGWDGMFCGQGWYTSTKAGVCVVCPDPQEEEDGSNDSSELDAMNSKKQYQHRIPSFPDEFDACADLDEDTTLDSYDGSVDKFKKKFALTDENEEEEKKLEPEPEVSQELKIATENTEGYKICPTCKMEMLSDGDEECPFCALETIKEELGLAFTGAESEVAALKKNITGEGHVSPKKNKKELARRDAMEGMYLRDLISVSSSCSTLSESIGFVKATTKKFQYQQFENDLHLVSEAQEEENKDQIQVEDTKKQVVQEEVDSEPLVQAVQDENEGEVVIPAAEESAMEEVVKVEKIPGLARAVSDASSTQMAADFLMKRLIKSFWMENNDDTMSEGVSKNPEEEPIHDQISINGQAINTLGAKEENKVNEETKDDTSNGGQNSIKFIDVGLEGIKTLAATVFVPQSEDKQPTEDGIPTSSSTAKLLEAKEPIKDDLSITGERLMQFEKLINEDLQERVKALLAVAFGVKDANEEAAGRSEPRKVTVPSTNGEEKDSDFFNAYQNETLTEQQQYNDEVEIARQLMNQAGNPMARNLTVEGHGANIFQRPEIIAQLNDVFRVDNALLDDEISTNEIFTALNEIEASTKNIMDLPVFQEEESAFQENKFVSRAQEAAVQCAYVAESLDEPKREQDLESRRSTIDPPSVTGEDPPNNLTPNPHVPEPVDLMGRIGLDRRDPPTSDAELGFEDERYPRDPSEHGGSLEQDSFSEEDNTECAFVGHWAADMTQVVENGLELARVRENTATSNPVDVRRHFHHVPADPEGYASESHNDHYSDAVNKILMKSDEERGESQSVMSPQNLVAQRDQPEPRVTLSAKNSRSIKLNARSVFQLPVIPEDDADEANGSTHNGAFGNVIAEAARRNAQVQVAMSPRINVTLPLREAREPPESTSANLQMSGRSNEPDARSLYHAEEARRHQYSEAISKILARNERDREEAAVTHRHQPESVGVQSLMVNRSNNLGINKQVHKLTVQEDSDDRNEVQKLQYHETINKILAKNTSGGRREQSVGARSYIVTEPNKLDLHRVDRPAILDAETEKLRKYHYSETMNKILSENDRDVPGKHTDQTDDVVGVARLEPSDAANHSLAMASHFQSHYQMPRIEDDGPNEAVGNHSDAVNSILAKTEKVLVAHHKVTSQSNADNIETQMHGSPKTLDDTIFKYLQQSANQSPLVPRHISVPPNINNAVHLQAKDFYQPLDSMATIVKEPTSSHSNMVRHQLMELESKYQELPSQGGTGGTARETSKPVTKESEARYEKIISSHINSLPISPVTHPNRLSHTTSREHLFTIDNFEPSVPGSTLSNSFSGITDSRNELSTDAAARREHYKQQLLERGEKGQKSSSSSSFQPNLALSESMQEKATLSRTASNHSNPIARSHFREEPLTYLGGSGSLSSGGVKDASHELSRDALARREHYKQQLCQKEKNGPKPSFSNDSELCLSPRATQRHQHYKEFLRGQLIRQGSQFASQE